MKKYILSLFLGIAIAANAQKLTVPIIVQENSNWCWAATSQSVLGYYGYSHSQCEIAEYARNNSTEINFGLIPCCENALSGCNQTNYNWYYPGSIEYILKNFGVDNQGMNSILYISQVQEEIDNNRPFIITWQYSNGQGHGVVGCGIEGNVVYYMDPAATDGEYRSIPYADLANDMSRRWVETNVMLVSPVETDASNITANAAGVTIYPNPVKDELRIESGELVIKKVEIFNISGKIIYQFNGLENQIDVSALPRGMYLMRIETDKGIESMKFIKE